MPKIQTTAKDFRAGLSVSDTKSTIQWEPTGHLSVKLLDASATRPIAGVAVTVQIPTEGTVNLTSDESGALFHPDVPFRDYELELGALGEVTVPAVAARSEQHVCAVSGARFGWIDLDVVDDRGIPLAEGKATVDGVTLSIDERAPGRVRATEPRPKNSAKITVTVGDARLDLALPVLPTRTVVRLPKKGRAQ